MKSQNITLSKSQAIRLARRGGFEGKASVTASKQTIGSFGEGPVRGWLEARGYKISDRALIIRAEDFGLDVFPSYRRWRMIEIATAEENLAVEVKTYGSHYLQGTVGDSLEEQLTDDLMWRKLSKGRTLALAIVTYYGKPSIARSDLNFLKINRIPILRFIITGMSGQ